MGREDMHSAERTAATSRRGFFRITAAAGLCLLRSAKAEPATTPLRLNPGTPRTRVVRAIFPHVIVDTTVHETIAREMLAATLMRLTDQRSTKAAWRAILKPADVVGIKFNRSGQSELQTTPVVGALLLESLIEAGWSPERIVCIEPPPGLQEQFGTATPSPGYDRSPTDFGSGADQLASVLGQVTALINVPFLKTHNIAGMSGCLKNLSHGLIKHPARYHGGECSPYITDIVALPQIRGKLRLNLVDALRVVFDGGPHPDPANIENIGVLLASFDPVAADTVGLATIDTVRKKKGMGPVRQPGTHLRQLADAHRRDLGIALVGGIDRLDVRP